MFECLDKTGVCSGTVGLRPPLICTCTNIIVYLTIVSDLIELQLPGGVHDGLIATAFTLLPVGRKVRVLYLQTTGEGLDLCHLKEQHLLLYFVFIICYMKGVDGKERALIGCG